MRKGWIYAIQIAISLVMVCGVAIGCAVPSSTSTPPASKYPADITGRVTIAETVKAEYQQGPHAGETMEMTPLEGQIYWIVDISVKNKSYENTVTANHNHWKIVVDDKVYHTQTILPGNIQPSYAMAVPMGETGETTIRFSVPDTLEISGAKICYQGQELYSYGKLSGGDRIAAYDWDLKKGVQEATDKVPATKIATVLRIQTSMVHLDSLYVELQPTSSALADKTYVVDLYENDRLRASAQVRWNQPELNVFKKKMVFFPLTTAEYRAYHLEDISHIFTAVVHE